MAEYFHGVSTRQVDTSVSTPVTADSGVAFVVGAAPAHAVGGAVNDPIMCQSYAEAVAAMGYSDNWKNYPVCEAIYAPSPPILLAYSWLLGVECGSWRFVGITATLLPKVGL